ncbi:54S ribosomal protein L12, mitochondrial precursor [Westerdykella ornata]|uniref:54S ribosomal protein L12, mitochondrial n=1 Tax=Westerdykella ornata TaxID=318751 RepID=A0A6A6JDZ3_WESOR|nr:54S ribosomal protein L12, mitochondrial precursor [Westerdykella ornata]KAF2274495.1 54S ribosomal protein L12, mitochondrial precursor [Westerdykella ornata]
MSAPATRALRRCVCNARSSSTYVRAAPVTLAQQRPARRWQSTDATAATNPKIASIVDQISQLTLLETADLVSTLKARLNIPDMPMGGFVAAGPGGAAAPAAAPAAEEEEAAPPAQEKSLFNLKLEKFDAAAKPKVIKEIKAMLGLSLVDSKKFVESAPKMMKEAVPKEEAEKIVEALKAIGATVTME